MDWEETLRLAAVASVLVSNLGEVSYGLATLPVYLLLMVFASCIVYKFISTFITSHISVGGNAVTSVRRSVCFHSVFGSD